MAFWGVEIKPGKPFTLLPDQTCCRLRISQATLGFGSSNNKSSSVQCNVGKKTPVLLCSLLPDKAESIHLELEFQEAEEVTFSVVGPRSVHLTGYVVGRTRQLLVGDDESESYGEDIGDTDTELSDDASDEDEYGGSFIDDGTPAFSPPSPSTSEEANKDKKKACKRKGTRKRLKKAYVLSESEDNGASSLNNCARNCVQIVESDEDDQKLISSLCGNVKMDRHAIESSCRKPDSVAGQATGDNQPDGEVTIKKLEIVVGQGADDCQVDDKKVKRKKRDQDDVAVQDTDDRKVKRRKKVDDDEAGQATDDPQSDDKKMKRKKRKNKTNESLVDTEKPSGLGKNEADALVGNGGTTTDLCTRTISGGLVIEELETGEQDGKLASSGRKVTVHYTGRLKEQGQVFYSTAGKSPLKFRLGKDAAIDGLHLGIDGMRAGGKRRLLIPPELGYGSQGTDGVPPNAWLIMEVELLRVR